jgi:hypothetical protein
MVFLQRVLRRICGATQEEVTGIISYVAFTVHCILEEEGMVWSCSMDRSYEKGKKCIHFSQKT